MEYEDMKDPFSRRDPGRAIDDLGSAIEQAERSLKGEQEQSAINITEAVWNAAANVKDGHEVILLFAFGAFVISLINSALLAFLVYKVW